MDIEVSSDKDSNVKHVSFYIPHFTCDETDITEIDTEEDDEDYFDIPCSQNVHRPRYDQYREQKKYNNDEGMNDDKSTKRR